LESARTWQEINRVFDGAKLCGLYRYEPSGTYFARVRFRGRLVRRKLDTTDFATAKRKLSDFRRDLRMRLISTSVNARHFDSAVDLKLLDAHDRIDR